MTVRQRETAAGSVVWFADFVGADKDRPAPAVKRHRPALGPEVKTRREAEAAEARLRVFIENEAAESRRGSASKQAREDSVGALAERWAKHNTATGNWKPSTVRLYRIILDNWLLPELGKVRLVDIDADKIDAFKVVIAERGREPKWNKSVLGVLAAMLAQALKWRMIAANPCLQVDQFKVPEAHFDWYREEESALWLSHAERLYPRLYPLFLTLFRAGLREGEAFALTWDDVDLAGLRLHIRRSITRGRVDGVNLRVTTDPKSRTGRFVDMAPDLAVALRAWRHPGDLVFPNAEGEPWTRDALRFQWKRITRAAELRLLTMHDARHSYASQLVSAGAPLTYVQHQLGHSTQRMTERYAHLAPQGQRWVTLLGEKGPASQAKDAPEAGQGTRSRHTPEGPQ